MLLLVNALQLSTRWFGHQVQLCNTFCKPPKTSLPTVRWYQELWTLPNVFSMSVALRLHKNKTKDSIKKEKRVKQCATFSFQFCSCLVLIFSIVMCGSKRKGQDKQWLTNITNHSWELTALVVTIISGRGVNEMTPVNATYEGSPRDISWAEVGQSYLPTTWKV